MYDPLRSKARVALGTALAFTAGLGIASGLGWTDATGPVIREEAQVPASAVRSALDLSDAFVRIAETVTPAVVRIESERRGRVAAGPTDGSDLRRFLPPGFDGRNPSPRGPSLGGGTGFIVSEDGYILTNDHVVDDADVVRVFLNDGREYPATVVGADPFTDVAVIRIDAGGALPTLSFGDSDGVRVGEWVLAVGNPGFGTGPASRLDYTVTAGIISARSRGLNLLTNELLQDPDTRDLANYAIEDFLQTDAVINPGNSGGPMVDLQGRVVGINSAIASATGYYQGYGFAIPVNLARRVMEDLIAYGYVKRPVIGVRIQTVTPEDAEAYELPSVAGALVQGVTPGGAAERAGIRPEDVITAVEGLEVVRSNELQQRIAQFRPGDEVTLTVYRDGRRREVDVVLGEEALTLQPTRTSRSEAMPEARLGIEIGELTRERAAEYGFEETGGAVVTGASPLGAAARRAVGRGARILEIDDEDVDSAEEAREILAEVRPGAIVQMVVQYPGQPPTVVNIRMPR